MSNLISTAMGIHAARIARPKYPCRECKQPVTDTTDTCPHCGERPFALCSCCESLVHPDGAHEATEQNDDGEDRSFVECDDCFEKNEPQRLAVAAHEEWLCQEDPHADR